MLLLRLSCTKSNTTPLLPSPISTSYTAITRSSPYAFSLPFPGRRCRLRKKKKRKFVSNCREKQRQDHEGEEPISRASPYEILGVEPTSSLADLKSAFRAKVKEFHPDVCRDAGDSDLMIRRVIQAYKILLEQHESEATGRESLDPFEEPECEALDLFVNEFQCIGKGCPYSCVARAPHAFSFDTLYGTARAISQGHGEDYQVQLAVGQCPRSCIHYVTPSQRVILEELLERPGLWDNSHQSHDCNAFRKLPQAELKLPEIIIIIMIANGKLHSETVGPTSFIPNLKASF